MKKLGNLSFNLFTLATKRPTYLQIVTFTVVKKSEATSRECQRNLSTCSWLVKTSKFYDLIYY